METPVERQVASTQDLGAGAPPSSLLDILEQEEWEALRCHMLERRYEPGDCLLAQGAIHPEFQIIVDGVACVSALKPSGERLELSRLGRGDCIGEMALLTGDPASADIHAITPVATCAIRQDALSVLHEQRSRLIEALSIILAGRLQRANERLLTMHIATVYAIDACVANPSLLARLPAEMAKAAGVRSFVLATGERYTSGRFLDAAAHENVTIERTGDVSGPEVRDLLHRLAHKHQQVIVFCDRDLLAEASLDAQVKVRLVPEQDAHAAAAQDAEQVVLLSDTPWTHANVRRLSSKLGWQVAGILPPRATAPGRRDPLAKLARVLTRRQVGIALGAGAAKGFAHIGVLRAFEELSVPIDVLTGTSIGAAIAAGYAAGLSPDELAQTASRISAKARRLTVPIYSFFSNGGLRDELQQIGARRRFEELDVPLAVVATDMYRRSEVTFRSGIVWPCVLASMAIPGIYPPLRARGSYMVDGGVLSPVPARQARALGAGFVIGVRLTGKSTSPRETLDTPPSRPLATETIMRAMEIMNNRISEVSNDEADVTIEVSLEGGGLSDFKRGKEYMDQGYQSALAAAEQLAAVISQPAARNA